MKQTHISTFKKMPHFCAPCSTGEHARCLADHLERCECGESQHEPSDRVAAGMRLFNRLDLDGDTIENLAAEYRARYLGGEIPKMANPPGAPMSPPAPSAENSPKNPIKSGQNRTLSPMEQLAELGRQLDDDIVSETRSRVAKA